MAFNVSFYNFSKRNNSTKRPEIASAAAIYPVNLKAPTSILHPTLLLNLPPEVTNPGLWTYAYIPQFNRFYFVSDWIFNRGLWEVGMDVDTLATYKLNIGPSTQYITRAAGESDGAIPDMLYPAKQGVIFSTTTADSPWETSLNGGRYVVGIINSAENGVGAVHYYVFTQEQFNQLCNYLLSNVDWLDISDISEQLTKALFNPFQYIVSCYWFPYVVVAGGSVDSIPIGWWSIPVSCGVLQTAPTQITLLNISVPKHPQAATRGKYLNGAPFSSFLFTFPGFGEISLDPNAMVDLNTLYCVARVDTVTGRATLIIHDGSDGEQRGHVLQTVRTQLAVTIQLAQMSSNLFSGLPNFISNAAAAVGGYFTGNIPGMIAGGASMISSAADTITPRKETLGTNGSFSELTLLPHIDAQFYRVADESNEHRGRPLCKEKRIDTLSGFMMVADPDIDFPGMEEEKQIVRDFLAGGFYYE